MKIAQQPTVSLNVTIQLNESEARALQAMACYGIESFLKVFYAEMGKHYLQPHEAGLVSLFEHVTRQLPPILKRTDAARKAFNE